MQSIGDQMVIRWRRIQPIIQLIIQPYNLFLFILLPFSFHPFNCVEAGLYNGTLIIIIIILSIHSFIHSFHCVFISSSIPLSKYDFFVFSISCFVLYCLIVLYYSTPTHIIATCSLSPPHSLLIPPLIILLSIIIDLLLIINALTCNPKKMHSRLIC